MRRRECTKLKLQQQQLENIKELKNIGIHYVSLGQYEKNPDAFKYAMGIVRL